MYAKKWIWCNQKAFTTAARMSVSGFRPDAMGENVRVKERVTEYKLPPKKRL